MKLDLVGTALSAAGLGLIVLGILRVGDLGLRAAQARGARVARPLAGHLAGAGGRRRPGAVPRVGEPAHRARRGRARRSRRCCATSSCARGRLVPVHVPDPGRHRSSSSRCSCRSRSGCRPSRRASGCYPSRSRCWPSPWASPSCWPDASPRRVVNLGFVTLFAGLVLLVALLDVGRGPGDRDLAAAAGRLRAGRHGLAARRRHRVRRPRRAERRGRRAAEHRHPARRLDRHRPGRRRADLGADRLVLHRHPGQPGRPRQRRLRRRRRSWPAASRSSPTPT